MQHGVSEIPTGNFLLVEELLESADPALASLASKPRKGRRPASTSAAYSRPSDQLVMAPVAVPTRVESRAPLPEPAPGFAATPARHYFFHALIGRSANDALSRVVGLRVSRQLGGNAVATADDYGFVLTLAPELSLRAEDLHPLLAADGFETDLDEALRQSHLLKYHFRNAAQTGLMVYRNYFGQQKAARKVQWSAEVIFNVLAQHEPDHVLLREARRDAHHSFLDADRAIAYLNDLQAKARPIRLRNIAIVPPLSFGMYATRIKEALLVEDPQETLERLYHHWWQKLGGTTPDETS